MVHSDDSGLVLPPKVAQTQVVVIPIVKKGDNFEAIKGKAEEMYQQLHSAGVRVELDDRDNYNPGWKYNHWELRGVPIRLELGAKDMAASEVRCCKRNDRGKMQLKQESVVADVQQVLGDIHTEMYNKALQARQDHVKDVDNWEDFMKELAGRNLCLAPWCDVVECEENVKARSKEESLQLAEESKEEGNEEEEALLTGSAKTLCIPFEQKPLAEGKKCFACDKCATTTALWGRSY